MSGRKMKTRRGLIAIFLPAIFLLAIFLLAKPSLAREPDLVNAP
jgi:hypothetical protein